MSSSTAAVDRYKPAFTESEQTTLLGVLAGYRSYTGDAYALDLRQFTLWCWQHHTGSSTSAASTSNTSP